MRDLDVCICSRSGELRVESSLVTSGCPEVTEFRAGSFWLGEFDGVVKEGTELKRAS
jgi:hypothetical protein